MTDFIQAKARRLFSAFTNDYVSGMYPDADLANADLKKKLQHIMQNRTLMFLAFKLDRNYKELLHINKITDKDLLSRIVGVLGDDKMFPEHIRNWWYSGGVNWSFHHRNAIKKKERDDAIALVVHDDSLSRFVNITPTGFTYASSIKDAIAYAINIPGVDRLSLTKLGNNLTKSNVRVFTVNRNALTNSNIITTKQG